MVAGHLQEKNGIYYVVLTYKTYDGKRKTKWQSTGLPTKGNKRRAEAMMRELQDDNLFQLQRAIRKSNYSLL